MNWAKRVPARPPRRSTNPYPIRFVAVCGQCPARQGYYDLDRVEGWAAVHATLSGHDAVEVVRSEEVES